AGVVSSNVKQVIQFGGQVERIFLGQWDNGGRVPEAVVTGSVMSPGFFLRSEGGTVAALTRAIPVSMQAHPIGVLVRVVNASFGPMAVT
ncbi:PTS sugar transporter subunit IIC, partial [Salmonella enterica]|uniref:PTS sugar transporter subunit IIC n=1 Tax=Salmonella enterica TaxID=28901 RepID=UPI00398C3277